MVFHDLVGIASDRAAGICGTLVPGTAGLKEEPRQVDCTAQTGSIRAVACTLERIKGSNRIHFQALHVILVRVELGCRGRCGFPKVIADA